jgi:hypothetical protein
MCVSAVLLSFADCQFFNFSFKRFSEGRDIIRRKVFHLWQHGIRPPNRTSCLRVTTKKVFVCVVIFFSILMIYDYIRITAKKNLFVPRAILGLSALCRQNQTAVAIKSAVLNATARFPVNTP